MLIKSQEKRKEIIVKQINNLIFIIIMIYKMILQLKKDVLIRRYVTPHTET